MASVAGLRAGVFGAAQAIQAANHAVGSYGAGPFAQVTVQDGPDELRGQVGVDLWAGLSANKLAARVLRKVREANGQIPRTQRGIVVVDVGGVKDLVSVQNQLALEARSQPRRFDCVPCVVAVARGSDPTSLQQEVTICMPLREPALSRLEWKVVEALLGRSPNEPLPTRVREPASQGHSFGPGAMLICPLVPTDASNVSSPGQVSSSLVK